MRQVRLPSSAPQMLYSRGPFRVQDYLKEIRSGLADVVVTPKEDAVELASALPGECLASVWINRAAQVAGISPQWILMVLQAEQSLTREQRPLPATYTVERVEVGGDRTEDTRYVVDKHGFVRVKGTWRMIAATGCGIPDPKTIAPWDTTKYLGFDRQVLWCGKLARRDIDKWKSGEREVKLYGGEVVECMDVESYVLLRWTPSESVLGERVKIYRGLFG